MKNGIMKYNIIRFFKDPSKKNKLIKKGLTLLEAQLHCKNPKTRKEGVWFDGFSEEKTYE